MNVPEWLKPGIYGGFIGAAVLAFVGFQFGGWVTGSKATQLASDRARTEVTAALVPICLDNSKRDPQLAVKVAAMKSAQSYDRSELIMKAGWATMPGATEPNRQVASGCLEKLAL